MTRDNTRRDAFAMKCLTRILDQLVRLAQVPHEAYLLLHWVLVQMNMQGFYTAHYGCSNETRHEKMPLADKTRLRSDHKTKHDMTQDEALYSS